MRIGDVNKDNYKVFLQMMGAKSTKVLDALFADGEKDGKEKKFLSIEELEREFDDEMIRSGFALEGMIIHDGDDISKWHKIVPVSDDVKNKIIDTVRKDFLEMGNGMNKEGGSREIPKINEAYLKSVSPKERLSVTWTLAQIQINEFRRLVDYVKKMDPTWTQGKMFDKNMLIKSNFGTNIVDVKG